MAHAFINTLKPGTYLEDIFMVTQPVLRSTTKGDLYIAMFLSDKTGKANCRVWSATEELFRQIPTEGFVKISAKTELYQGTLQIVANAVEPVKSDQVDLSDYMPQTKKDVEKMFTEVTQILSTITNPQIRALINEFLADTQLIKNFKIAPAAVKMHHAYLGGLLEHTHSMLSVASRILPVYPEVHPDMVLAGIFLHDIAKTRELTYNLAFAYSNTGQLIGHIVQGAIMLDQKADICADRGTPITQDILDSLTHIILSHHGKYEFGSPKLPATPEALMVSYIDDLDAKLNFVADAFETDSSDEDWTSWKPLNVNVGTRYFKKRIAD